MDSIPNQDEASTQEDSRSEPEIGPRSHFYSTSNIFKHVCAMNRGSQDGLDHEWWSLFKIYEMGVKRWKYTWVWACHACGEKKMHEGDCLDWGLWDWSVCVLEFKKWRGACPRCYMGEMRSEQDLTCLQTLGKVKEVWMNGTTLYKHK